MSSEVCYFSRTVNGFAGATSIWGLRNLLDVIGITLCPDGYVSLYIASS